MRFEVNLTALLRAPRGDPRLVAARRVIATRDRAAVAAALEQAAAAGGAYWRDAGLPPGEVLRELEAMVSPLLSAIECGRAERALRRVVFAAFLRAYYDVRRQ